ncbi:MAG: hypothetical protein IPG88_20740 [Gemmatimonadetes bacterium]|nr:hypothetical protein [Gemmatimonadota bacterium]
MRDPVYEGRASVMFYAGDDAAASRSPTSGRPTWASTPSMRVPSCARELEHLAVLWISLAMGVGGTPSHGRSIAFRLMRR